MYGYIYITTNLINGKKYIGQHKSSVFTDKYKGSGKYLCNAFRKYGFDNFKVELIEECNSEEELNEREVFWIKEYNAVYSKDFYNITKGGNYHAPYDGLTDDDKAIIGKKISDASIGRRIMNNGEIEVKVYPDQVCEYKSKGYSLGQLPSHANVGSRNGMYGRTHTDEVKARLVKCNTGENNHNYGRHWYNDGVNSIMMTEEEASLKPEYVLGRLDIKVTKPRGRPGVICINNGVKSIKVLPEDYENNYDKLIWRKGRLKKSYDRA